MFFHWISFFEEKLATLKSITKKCILVISQSTIDNELVIRTMFGSIETIDIFDNIDKGVYFIDNTKDVLQYISRNYIILRKEDINKLWQQDSKTNLSKNIKEIMEVER